MASKRNVMITSTILTHLVITSSLEESSVVNCVLSEQVCNSKYKRNRKECKICLKN